MNNKMFECAHPKPSVLDLCLMIVQLMFVAWMIMHHQPIVSRLVRFSIACLILWWRYSDMADLFLLVIRLFV